MNAGTYADPPPLQLAEGVKGGGEGVVVVSGFLFSVVRRVCYFAYLQYSTIYIVYPAVNCILCSTQYTLEYSKL